MASRKVARKFECQTALAHARISIYFRAVTRSRNRKLFENYLIRRPFESLVKMTAFASKQLDLLHSPLHLEYADGNLDEVHGVAPLGCRH